MHQSGEKYLETIYLLSCEKPRVRAIDVAKALGYSKPSVSRAMGKLKDAGMFEETGNLDLVLSKEGLKKAKAIVEKEEMVAQFLMMTTDVDETTAQRDACEVAYHISDKTYKGIKSFIKAVEEMN